MRPGPLRDPLHLAVGGLAVARLTRLVTDDTITEPLRQRVAGRWPQAETFLRCPWCVSIWLAAGWAGLSALAPSVVATGGPILAWSQIAGLLAGLA